MVSPLRLSRADARRVAVHAQLLTADRPSDVVECVRRLTLVQLDPTSAIAPSADLVLWSRLGAAYDPSDLRDLVDEQRLLDLRGALRPAEDLALYRAEMAQWPGVGELRDWQVFRERWLEDNESFRRDILDAVRADGPLTTADLPDTCVVPWQSSGWNNRRNVAMMLDLLVQRGEVATAGGWGAMRLWDLASRVYPDAPVPSAAEARHERDVRRLASLGIARAKAAEHPVEPTSVGEVGVTAVVEGTRGSWRVDPAMLDMAFEGRVALLSPFDRLLHDRRRMAELFEFDYVLEMYKPASARRWGYYALPVLHGDRLVGKLDAKADHAAGVLRVTALHDDIGLTSAMRGEIVAEVEALATWLGLELDLPL